ALALAQAVATAVDLLHHGLDVAALGDAMAVPAMGRNDEVVAFEIFADADGDRFLTRIEMGEARDLAGHDLRMQTFLEHADRLHLTIGPGQLVTTELHVSSAPPVCPWRG